MCRSWCCVECAWSVILHEVDEVFTGGMCEVVEDAEFALCEGSFAGVVEHYDGSEHSFLVLDGYGEYGSGAQTNLVEDIVFESGFLGGISDELADSLFGAVSDDALSHGDSEVEEFFGFGAAGYFEPKLLVGAIDIGE